MHGLAGIGESPLHPSPPSSWQDSAFPPPGLMPVARRTITAGCLPPCRIASPAALLRPREPCCRPRAFQHASRKPMVLTKHPPSRNVQPRVHIHNNLCGPTHAPNRQSSHPFWRRSMWCTTGKRLGFPESCRRSQPVYRHSYDTP